MKGTILALTLATAAICADGLEFPIHEHRVGFAPTFDQFGAGIGYEHVKPDSFYLAVSSAFVKHANMSIFGAGYNFALTPNDKLTPSFGVGVLYIKGLKNLEYLPIVNLEYSHRFNDRLSVGAFIGSVPKYNFNITVGMPLTVHFGADRDWDVKLTPSYSRSEDAYFTAIIISLAYSLGKSF